jgi:site-specific DNA-methyltransferase (adenine-specific)
MLDPFNGSGTSMIFAARNHVRAIGIDLNKEYCEHTVSELNACRRHGTWRVRP